MYMVSLENVTIDCSDSFKLCGTLYRPIMVKGAVMIAPATGIKRIFYHSFAQYLAQNNYGVLTYDNRGIGDSIGESINTGNPSLTNWGVLDMTAILEHLKAAFPEVDYHLVGHSAGGQLVGLMKNALELKSMFNFGSSSGSLHYSKYPFRLKSSFWLNFYIPLSNFIYGHTKSQWVGMGEPLPKNVGTEWKRWCNGKGYVKVDLDTKIKHHLYNELDFDALWVHSEDDDIANYENVKDMISVYSKVNSKILTLNPEAYEVKDIGHMKFFSSKRSKLWTLAINWLNKQQ